MKKEALFNKNQIIHIKNEQLFMSKVKSQWIVELKASFQDFDYLYLVMEFLQGGDLMNILIKKDILSEDEAQFYIAEIILAIESIHNLDCIHRDIKPDNVLIDKNGHIKLTDFGLAKISDKILYNNIDKNTNINNDKIIEKENGTKTHNKNYSCVGTAYYVAPEVLNKKGYGPEIDWWSVGVIFFEMLVGYVPFCSNDTNEACYKVLNWKQFLKFPPNIRISSEAEDLIFKMINSPKNRLGKNGAKEIKSHPFFYGFNWDNIQNIKPPFIPFLRNEYDTSYFETYERKEPFYPPINNTFKRKNVEYLDYSFRNDSLNDITLNDEYENAIKYLNEFKEENKKNNSYNEKNVKKRSNGGNTLGIFKTFPKSQNEANNISILGNHNKQIPCLKTISNNSSKGQMNKTMNSNSYNNTFNKIKLTNCSSIGISKNKVNIIKIGQKKFKKINDSLNRIIIPKIFNKNVKNVNTNKKSKRTISPIFKNLYNTSHNTNNNYLNKYINKTTNNNNNKLMSILNHYKSYHNNIYKQNKKLNYNRSYLNILFPNNNNNKNRVFFSYRNDKKVNGLKLNNLSTNNKPINVLYTNYIKGQKNINTQNDKSYQLGDNKIKFINIKNKSLRLSPLKNPDFFKKIFFNRKSIPSNIKKKINHNGMKSPLIYLKTSKVIYPKEIYKISKYNNNNTIGNNSFREKNKIKNIKKSNKNANINNKNI